MGMGAACHPVSRGLTRLAPVAAARCPGETPPSPSTWTPGATSTSGAGGGTRVGRTLWAVSRGRARPTLHALGVLHVPHHLPPGVPPLQCTAWCAGGRGAAPHSTTTSLPATSAVTAGRASTPGTCGEWAARLCCMYCTWNAPSGAHPRRVTPPRPVCSWGSVSENAHEREVLHAMRGRCRFKCKFTLSAWHPTKWMLQHDGFPVQPIYTPIN